MSRQVHCLPLVILSTKSLVSFDPWRSGLRLPGKACGADHEREEEGLNHQCGIHQLVHRPTGICPLQHHQSNSPMHKNERLALLGSSHLTMQGAILQLTRCLAMDCGSWNIRVNCVCPGMKAILKLDIMCGFSFDSCTLFHRND